MKDNLLIKFGEILKSLRLARELSQEELADIAGVHRTYIGMIERGEKNITLRNLFKIAQALKINPSDLLPKIDK